MRNISDVINNMIEICGSNDKRMIKIFNSIDSSARCSAPENMYLHWERLSDCLNKFYEQYKQQLWFQEILSVMSTKPLNEIQELISKECN